MEDRELLRLSCLYMPLIIQSSFIFSKGEEKKERGNFGKICCTWRYFSLRRLPILFSAAGSQIWMVSSSTFRSQKGCWAGDGVRICERKNGGVGQDEIAFLGFMGGTCSWPESLVYFKITTVATTEQKENNLFAAILLWPHGLIDSFIYKLCHLALAFWQLLSQRVSHAWRKVIERLLLMAR